MIPLAILDTTDLVAALRRVEPELHVEVKAELAKQAKAVELRAKLNHDYDSHTGKLTQSIEAESVRPLGKGYQATISADAGYAKFIECGTKAHMVKPRKAPALRFFVGGKAVFSRGHMVKGIVARKFLENAAFDQLEPMRDGMEDATIRAFAAAGFEVQG